jgi:hypothetical protein
MKEDKEDPGTTVFVVILSTSNQCKLSEILTVLKQNKSFVTYFTEENKVT